MWDIVAPHCSRSWEPEELKLLKQELAHLACKCDTCTLFRNTSLHKEYQSDEAVQVEPKMNPLNKYIYVTSDEHTDMMDYFRRDAFCPNCYFIWDLLRRTAKVFKDECSETKPDSSDKSTEKAISIADSTTSVTKKPLLNVASNLTFCDYISNCSSTTSVNNRNDPSSDVTPLDRKRGGERVTFLDDHPCKDEMKKEPPTFIMQGNCFCLENYMDCIRPPLKM